MLWRSLLGLTFVSLATMAACGGSSDDDSRSIKLDDLPKEFADAQCKIFEKCFGPLIEIFLRGEDCRTSFERSVANSDLSELKAAVEAGDVSYDGSKAAKCLDSLE